MKKEKIYFILAFLFIHFTSFSQSDSSAYIFANGLGNGVIYSLNAEYAPNLNTKIRPGIQFGGGVSNVIGNDAKIGLPARFNIHFNQKRKHHFIIGGGINYKIDKEIKGEGSDRTEATNNFFFGSNYHLDIGSALMFRAGADITYLGDSHIGLVLPIPNVSFGARF